ncbi:uncharacterized protein A4U43_C09F3340 [Asparagus officinalis]|uniref:Smr domain-containing protein n=1 Tax=Asparagus officinalis TaxID=4686 RepID=A0A5P1E896_ASPOF|nr:uncharacterized protein A4U43_C09F3340 [Asparagus officinalis]
MQRPRGQGWADFDRKQRHKQGTGTEYNVEGDSKTQIVNDNSVTKHHIDEMTRKSDATPVTMLKDKHPWADQTLIEDVLVAVNNDVDQTSVLLKEMVMSESQLEDHSLSGPTSSTESYTCEIKSKCLTESSVVENKLPDRDHEVSMSKSTLYVPVEPEWEEDDVYLSHRKDAIRMMRLASQHSRAASNAFLRGDHVSAQQYSSRARDEWLSAEKLNANAAKKILSIRNNQNDIWNIDLHGLHASEAVSALKDHLQNIEEMPPRRSASSDKLTKLEGGISRSASCEYVGGIEANSETKKKELPQQRQMILNVVTGMGNHSRGQAALPLAIKSFLIENGYRFDDARPGVFAVRPKFRHK